MEEKRRNYRNQNHLNKIASEEHKEKIKKILKKAGCCFLHQAYRYRIKNNYKEFRHLNVLGYSIVNELKEILEKVLMIFCYISVVFCANAISIKDNSFYDLLISFPKFTQVVDFDYLTSLIQKS